MAEDGKDTDRLLREHGVILLSGEIDDAAAESICKEIIAYNLAGEVDRIQILVNSPGGSCSAGFAIIDMMEWSKLPVSTAGIGRIASMGLLVFMAGHRGRRVVTSKTSILSHRFSGGFRGSHGELVAGRKEQDLLHDRIVGHYLRYSNVGSREELEQYLLREIVATYPSRRTAGDRRRGAGAHPGRARGSAPSGVPPADHPPLPVGGVAVRAVGTPSGAGRGESLPAGEAGGAPLSFHTMANHGMV